MASSKDKAGTPHDLDEQAHVHEQGFDGFLAHVTQHEATTEMAFCL
jgi:hypothetical protein